jgi:hypothetical protein
MFHVKHGEGSATALKQRAFEWDADPAGELFGARYNLLQELQCHRLGQGSKGPQPEDGQVLGWPPIGGASWRLCHRKGSTGS